MTVATYRPKTQKHVVHGFTLPFNRYCLLRALDPFSNIFFEERYRSCAKNAALSLSSRSTPASTLGPSPHGCYLAVTSSLLQVLQNVARTATPYLLLVKEPATYLQVKDRAITVFIIVFIHISRANYGPRIVEVWLYPELGSNVTIQPKKALTIHEVTNDYLERKYNALSK